MKTMKKILMGVVLALGLAPRAHALLPLGNPDDPVYVAIASSLTVTGSFNSALSSFTVLSPSSGTCSGTASLVVAANSNVLATFFCNESTNTVRIGPAGVTSSVGGYVAAGACVSMDGPTVFKGALYCAAATAGNIWSLLRGLP